MGYHIKELFYTLQGEGLQSGRCAVFLRFSGCNLWSGLERDRATAACPFCDTDFLGTDGPGGGLFSDALALAAAVRACWSAAHAAANAGGRPYVVCTGGEPLLQLDQALIEALHAQGFEVAVETNGTRAPPPGLDWVCVSPKGRNRLVLVHGDELKLVFPQVHAPPEDFLGLSFRHFLLQPMDGPEREHNTRLALAYCLAHPAWRLSLQTHKWLGIP
jgi:7-carboxy-7-deazaguanine synthase (Cx14CxxC type)